jgi:uncharacterized protein YcfJ
MHKLLIVCAAVLSLSACTSTQKAATVGGVAGAVIGGTTTGSLVGAAVGGAVGATAGAVAGELLGRYEDDPNQCVYIDRRTKSRYLDDCPNG